MRGLILLALTAGAAAQADMSNPAVAAAAQATGTAPVNHNPANMSPLERVISLLKKMQDDTRAAKEADAEQYEQMQCWCSTNGSEKKKAIAEAEKESESLDSSIKENLAEAEQLKQEIKDLQKQISDNEATLEEATALRNKDHAAFIEKNQDLLDALEKLGGAIDKLKKWNGGDDESFIQLSEDVHALKGHFTAQMQADLMDFLAASAPSANLRGVQVSALQQGRRAPGFKSYASRSGQIFGVLEGLQDQMKRDNEEALTTEKKQAKAFERLRDSKLKEIEDAKANVVTKTNQLSEAQVAAANAKADLKSTFGDLEADRKFVEEMEKTCASWDKDYEARTETRNQEIKAIDETLAILRDNEARDTFAASSAVFLQIASDKSAVMARAAAVLRKTGSSQLSALAFTMKLKPMEKVKQAMDKMVTELKSEQKAEFEKKDYCDKSFMENENANDDATNEKEDLEAAIASLDSEIAKLTTEIADLKTQEGETEVSLKKAGMDRKAENLAYQKTVKDNRMCKAILNKALTRLASFYAPDLLTTPAPGVALAQEPGKANAPQPGNFKEYEKSGSAPGVISMMQGIIQEVESETMEAVEGEQNAQKSFAEMTRASKEDLEKNRATQAEKEGQKAQKETDKAARQGDHTENEEELKSLAKTNADLHTECDFLMKNFEVRQQARSNEIEAIGQAKAILSGANFQ